MARVNSRRNLGLSAPPRLRVNPLLGARRLTLTRTCGHRAPRYNAIMPELESTLTCPQCGARATETMPTNACLWFYDCLSCAALLKPLPGDCCVFCSYGDVKCPPVQQGQDCC